MFSCRIYCQTSISVQFEIGNTRKCSPIFFLPLKRFQSSGLWFLGSHCPKSSRCEKKRSFARAFSSSRRAPPIAASILLDSIASRRVVVCKAFRLAFLPVSSCTAPVSIDSCTDPTISSAPKSLIRLSRNSIVSGKLCPVSICIKGKGIFPG